MQLQQFVRRRWIVGHLILVTGIFTFAVSSTATPRSSADTASSAAQVADEIVVLQSRADQVAVEWVRRDDEAKQLADESSAAAQAVADAAATTDAIAAKVTKMAVDRYTGANDPSFLPFSDQVMTRLEQQQLTALATDTSVDDIDRYRAAVTDLRAKQRALEGLQADNAAARDRLEQTQTSLDATLSRLQQLHTKLQDAEVKRIYEVRLAELRAKQAADVQAAQAAQALVANTSAKAALARGDGAAAPSLAPPSATTAPPPKAPTPSASTTATASPAPTPATPGSATPPTTASPTAAPAVAAAPVAPEAPRAPSPTFGGLICPVAGPNAFGDTWGAPRQGGRSHEGVDMMSPQGTPLVAVIDGSANMHTNALGGNTVGLNGADGNYYYYAHLSAWAGPSRNVRQGDVIGYVGHTGDTAANHLHFGIYLGGGPAVNPYLTVRSIC